MKPAGFLNRLLALWLMCLTCTAFSQDIDRNIRLGDSLYYSNPDSSYFLCRCAERDAIKEKNAALTAKARLCKVRYLILKTKYSEATSDLNKAIDWYKKTGDKNGLARAYNFKAILLERLGDNESKYNYANEAVRLYEETGNVEGQVKMLTNLSLDYIYERRFKEAEAALDKILLMIDRLKQTEIYYYYQNRGILHLYKNEYEKAVLNLQTAMGIAREKQMVDSEISALTRLAETNIKLKKIALAQEQLDKARELAVKNNLNFELDEVYSLQIDLNVQQEKYKSAYETLLLRSQLREKTDHLQGISRINEEDHRNEMAFKLNARIEQLKTKNKGLEDEIDQVKTTWWVFVTTSGVLMLFLVWAVWAIKNQKRKLADQREVIGRLHSKDRS